MRLTFAAASAVTLIAFPASAQNNVVEIAPPSSPVAISPDVEAPDAPAETDPAGPAPAPAPQPSEPVAPSPSPPPPSMTTEELPVSPDAPYPEGFADPVDPYADDAALAYGGEDDGFDWGLLGLLGLFGLLGLRRGDRYTRTVYREPGSDRPAGVP